MTLREWMLDLIDVYQFAQVWRRFCVRNASSSKLMFLTRGCISDKNIAIKTLAALAIVFLADWQSDCIIRYSRDKACTLFSHIAGTFDEIPETRSSEGTSVITWESALQIFLASKAIFHDEAEHRLLVSPRSWSQTQERNSIRDRRIFFDRIYLRMRSKCFSHEEKPLQTIVGKEKALIKITSWQIISTRIK